MGLRLKFNLALLAAFGIGFLIAAAVLTDEAHDVIRFGAAWQTLFAR